MIALAEGMKDWKHMNLTKPCYLWLGDPRDVRVDDILIEKRGVFTKYWAEIIKERIEKETGMSIPDILNQ